MLKDSGASAEKAHSIYTVYKLQTSEQSFVDRTWLERGAETNNFEQSNRSAIRVKVRRMEITLAGAEEAGEVPTSKIYPNIFS